MLNSTFRLSMVVFCRSDHCSALEKMDICLGKAQLVKAIDDGGISMYFRRDPFSSQQSRCVILSVEATPLTAFLINPGKAEKHIKDNNEDTANRHAAQIYAEMLGQVCHCKFYEQMENEYQEVSSKSLPLKIQ